MCQLVSWEVILDSTLTWMADFSQTSQRSPEFFTWFLSNACFHSILTAGRQLHNIYDLFLICMKWWHHMNTNELVTTAWEFKVENKPAVSRNFFSLFQTQDTFDIMIDWKWETVTQKKESSPLHSTVYTDLLPPPLLLNLSWHFCSFLQSEVFKSVTRVWHVCSYESHHFPFFFQVVWRDASMRRVELFKVQQLVVCSISGTRQVMVSQHSISRTTYLVLYQPLSGVRRVCYLTILCNTLL